MICHDCKSEMEIYDSTRQIDIFCPNCRVVYKSAIITNFGSMQTETFYPSEVIVQRIDYCQ